MRGLGAPARVKAAIVDRYHRFGGSSPINDHTRALVAALQTELTRAGRPLRVYWGTRNWHPLLPDVMRRMAGDGVRRVAAFITSTFSSYSSCRRYREDLHAALCGLEPKLRVDRLRMGYNHPGFLTAMADRLRSALAEHPPHPVLFTAHSLPLRMARCCDYVGQLQEASRLAAERAGVTAWRLVYQSNNASYGEPWLQPDIGGALREVRDAGHKHVTVVPIGFICDHMEVVLDLDIEAQAQAQALGLRMTRAGTVGTHPAFVAMIRELVEERMQASPVRRWEGAHGPAADYCAPDCCLSGRPTAPRAAIGAALSS